MRDMLLRTRTKTNPLFYADQVRLLLDHDPERIERMLTSRRASTCSRGTSSRPSTPTRTGSTSPGCSSRSAGRTSSRRSACRCGRAGTRSRVSSRATSTSGTSVRLPVRMRTSRSSPVRRGAGAHRVAQRARARRDHVRPLPRGRGGRDRIVELVDAGLVHAGRVGKELAIAVVYRSGTEVRPRAVPPRQRAARPEGPRRRDAVAHPVPEVVFREMSWQQLLRLWENERSHYKLFGQPVRGFLRHAEGSLRHPLAGAAHRRAPCRASDCPATPRVGRHDHDHQQSRTTGISQRLGELTESVTLAITAKAKALRAPPGSRT
jgi:hypothetical protein